MPVLQPAELWREHGPLRHRRAVQAPGPPGRRARPGHDPRGDAHLPHGARGPLLPRPPEAALPLPDQGARRAAAARRRAADARVHHEGRLLLRPRRDGLDALLRPAHRGLRPHLRPRRARVVPGRVRRGDDGRARRPRVHGALRGRRERGRAVGRRATPPTWRWRAPRRSRWTACPRRCAAPEAVDTPGATTHRSGVRHARGARRAR